MKLPEVVPDVGTLPIVFVPLKLSRGKIPSMLASISLRFNRTMPAGLVNTVAVS
jgi:hypothetical protein